MKIQRPKSRSKGSENASFKRKTNRAGQTPPRAARGGMHGRGGGTHGRVPCTHSCACPGAYGLFGFSFATLRFSAGFAVFLLIMLMYLAYRVGRIHRIDSLTLSKTPLKKEEEEEGCEGKRRRFGGESRDRHSALQ